MRVATAFCLQPSKGNVLCFGGLLPLQRAGDAKQTGTSPALLRIGKCCFLSPWYCIPRPRSHTLRSEGQPGPQSRRGTLLPPAAAHGVAHERIADAKAVRSKTTANTCLPGASSIQDWLRRWHWTKSGPWIAASCLSDGCTGVKSECMIQDTPEPGA
jgi:hypothetical protein